MEKTKQFSTGIYCIINLINNKKYMGSSSTSIKSRWRTHKSRLRRGCHRNYRLQRDWDKYGEDAFDFRVLIYTEPDEALPLEQWILDNYSHLFEYNIARDATAPFRGRKHTNESKAKMSDAKIGHSVSEESRKKDSEAHSGENNYWFGKHHSEQTRSKIREANSGDKNYRWIDIPGEKIDEMKRLRGQGYTYQKIGEIFSVSRNTVQRRLNLS